MTMIKDFKASGSFYYHREYLEDENFESRQYKTNELLVWQKHSSLPFWTTNNDKRKHF
jgi:hypothetical protein